MYERDRYLTDIAGIISNWFGKPSAVITLVAFLFAWTIAAPLLHIPMIGYQIVVTAIISIILLMVFFLQNTHKRDIRSLQARLDTLATELQAVRTAGTEKLGDAELQAVRNFLRKQSDDEEDLISRSNRDKRPSLF